MKNSGAGFQPAKSAAEIADIWCWNAASGRQDACPTTFFKHALKLRLRYSSDLRDLAGNCIAYCFPKAKRGQRGRPRQHPCRELLNAGFHLTKTGCQWRNLPAHFAPRRTVYPCFRQWKQKGLWEALPTPLREWVRLAEGRKRHLRVDALGLILLARVLPATLQDRDGARQRLKAFCTQSSRRRRVKHLWADGGCAGALLAGRRKLGRCTVEIVRRTELHRFKVLPRRWGVARTCGWLGRYRRRRKEYERQAQTGQTMVQLAMIRLMRARAGRL